MQTIGERLEEARKRKGISIREAAEATKVRGDYLHKFESNQFDIKLPEIYVRGFLRLYGNFLKLPGDKLVSDYLALGLGEGGRPQGKGLNREIYGKMEISHSGASSAKKNEPPPPHPLSGDDSPRASAPQRQPFQPRMPLGGLDRALLAKNGVWIGLGGVLVLGLVIWGVVAFVGRRPAETPSSPPTTQSQPVEEPVYLMALRPVQVTSVKGRLDGVELAAPRALVTGERLPLPNADMAIGVSDRSAVQFEFRGVRYGGGTSTGPGVLTLNFTAQR
jgi:transcriptional regulator with XRE-family HTH domain